MIDRNSNNNAAGRDDNGDGRNGNGKSDQLGAKSTHISPIPIDHWRPDDLRPLYGIPNSITEVKATLALWHTRCHRLSVARENRNYWHFAIRNVAIDKVITASATSMACCACRRSSNSNATFCIARARANWYAKDQMPEDGK